MAKEKFILTTDYKCHLFSAVFSLEGQESIFNSMDKADLLHSYMVSRIMIEFDKYEQEGIFNDTEFLKGAVVRVKDVLDSVKKRVSESYEKRLAITLSTIEERYPFETKCVNELIKDPTGVVCSSFFVPQIIMGMINHHENSENKKLPHLISINLNQFVDAIGSSNESAITDAVNLWREKDLENQLQNSKGIENLRHLIKQTVQVSLVANGDFQKFVQSQNAETNATKKEKEG